MHGFHLCNEAESDIVCCVANMDTRSKEDEVSHHPSHISGRPHPLRESLFLRVLDAICKDHCKFSHNTLKTWAED